MAQTWWLMGLMFALLLILLLWWSYRAYQRKARAARAKSLAALNTLLLEADQIAQSRRVDPEDPATEE